MYWMVILACLGGPTDRECGTSVVFKTQYAAKRICQQAAPQAVDEIEPVIQKMLDLPPGSKIEYEVSCLNEFEFMRFLEQGKVVKGWDI